MTGFKNYATVYDRLYAEKPYAKECAIVDTIARRYENAPVKTLLDLGCGTGGHALVWAKQGLTVCGADVSTHMLAIAKDKTLRARLAVEFIENDVQTLDTGRTWDRIVAMFAVISYLAEPDDIDQCFSATRNQLKPGSLFIFDVWYGNGMGSPPRDRVTRIHDEQGEIIKIATSSHKPLAQQVDIDFTVLSISGNLIKNRIEENHRLRYFFPRDLELIAKRSDFELLEINSCDSASEPPAPDDWTARVTFRAI